MSHGGVNPEGMTRAEVEAAVGEELPVPGSLVRVLFCTDCGALTFIRFSGNSKGTGDPLAHGAYHERLGTLADEVFALQSKVAELEERIFP